MYRPPGGLYLMGRFNGGFFVLPVWEGLYLEGLIFEILRYWSVPGHFFFWAPIILSLSQKRFGIIIEAVNK